MSKEQDLSFWNNPPWGDGKQKYKLGLNKVEDTKERLFNNLMFIPFGIPILIMDFLADMKYFWMNNFRTELDVIIIPKEKSLITHKSIKEV